MQEDEDKTGDANIQGKKDKFKNIPEEEEVEEEEEADEAREPFRSTAFRPGKTNKIHNFFLPNVTRRKHGELFFPFFISNNCHTRISAPASTFFSLIRRKEISLSPSSAVPFPNFPVKNILSQQWEGKGRRGKREVCRVDRRIRRLWKMGGLGWEVHGWTFLCVRPIKSSLPDTKRRNRYTAIFQQHTLLSLLLFCGKYFEFAISFFANRTCEKDVSRRFSTRSTKKSWENKIYGGE